MWDLILSVPDHCLSFYPDQFHLNPRLDGMSPYVFRCTSTPMEACPYCPCIDN